MRRLCPNPSLPSSSRPSFLLLLSRSRGSHSVAQRHQLDEESRQVRVSVWWDFENCNLPVGTNVFGVSSAISAAVRANGIKGPLEITAFGDMLQLSRPKQEGLSSTGVNLIHIPYGGKNSADRSILLNLMCWVSQNPPPAHLFLISGDRDFASVLHRLRLSNYNILLATPDKAHGVLCSAASIMWNWYDLLRGQNLTGKYFNQPPDGPYGSWYGHYKTPLRDPFSSSSDVSLLQPAAEPDTPCLVPKAVIKQIRKILESNPNGIFLSNLRSELAKNMNVDKEYYGFRKFLPFLLSLSSILKIKRVGDNQVTVYGHDYDNVDVNGRPESGSDRKAPLSLPTNPNVKDKARNAQNDSPLDENTIKTTNSSDEWIFEALGDENVIETDEAPKSESESFPSSGDEKIAGDEKIVETDNAPESSIAYPAVVQQQSLSEPGFFQRFWKKWFGSESSNSDNKSCEGEMKPQGNDSEKYSKPTVGFVDPSSHSSPLKAVADMVFVDRIRNWFGDTSDTNKPRDCSSEEAHVITADSRHELFSKDSFWSTMESFMGTSQGSLLVSKSKTRKRMARELQRNGPECLRPLGESDLLHLVGVLISEKKWVEECPTEAFPFKLSSAVKSSGHEIHPRTSPNNLSSLFGKPPNRDENGKPENVSRVAEENSPARSRDEVLADCQNLINDILKEHRGGGFFIGLFRKQFLERYGYRLSYQKLGYPELAALLTTMSGLKIVSGRMVPCDTVVSDGLHSPWEELGPIASSKLDKEQTDLDYEAAISEDESPPENTKKPGGVEAAADDSSLLKILDSWHGSSELCKNKSESLVPADDLATKFENFSSGGDESAEAALRSRVRKKLASALEPKKRYSFVIDENRNEKMAIGALRNLAKNEKDKVLCE